MNPEDIAFEEFLAKNANFRQTLREDVMPRAMKSLYWLRRMGNIGNLGFKLMKARPQYEIKDIRFEGAMPSRGVNPYFAGMGQ